MNSKFGISILLLFLALLSACGFHLRGEAQLPPQMARTYVQGLGQYNDLGRDIRRLLEGSGVEVVETPDTASAILKVIENRTARRVLSVRASGKVSEYELVHRFVFSLKATDGTTLIEPQELELNREYLYDRNDPLSSGGEETAIWEEMRRDIAQLVMLRLQTLGRQLR